MKNTKIIAVANQKGGVGKTTTAINLGAVLNNRGFKTLLIDFDPQASLTRKYLHHEFTEEQKTINELMKAVSAKEACDIYETICHNEQNNIDYIPADIRFSAMEINLVNTRCRETVLDRALKKSDTDYDYIIIDCPPSLGILLYNALSASDYVIIPVSAQIMALDGIPLLLDTIDDVKEYTNSKLEILGVVANWVEKTKMSEECVETLKLSFGDKYLGAISKSTAAQESSDMGIALCNYRTNSANKYYNKLADEYSAIVDKIECVTVTHKD